jgi:hypothetical protein
VAKTVFGTPSHDTFNRAFAALDSSTLQQCFLSWIESVASLTKGELVSIDGKRLCSSGQDGKRSIIHLVSAWSEANSLVLAQCKMGDKSNEITAIPTLLDVLELKGCIVSTRAMGCQREIAQRIIAKGAHYILAVKDNQPFLGDDLKEAFAQSPPASEDIQVNVGHGRIEKRTCCTLQEPEWVCRRGEWKSLQILIEITAERTHKATGEYQKKPATTSAACRQTPLLLTATSESTGA